MWKKIKTGLIIIVILGILVSILPLPVRIDTTISGIRWKDGEPNYSEPVDITIDGTYLRYLFKRNEFSGHISISGEERTYTENSFMENVRFLDANFLVGSLVYNVIDYDLIHAGDIIVNGAFKKVGIHLMDEEKDYYISAPATDRQSAYDVAIDLKIAKYYGLS